MSRASLCLSAAGPSPKPVCSRGKGTGLDCREMWASRWEGSRPLRGTGRKKAALKSRPSAKFRLRLLLPDVSLQPQLTSM